MDSFIEFLLVSRMDIVVILQVKYISPKCSDHRTEDRGIAIGISSDRSSLLNRLEVLLSEKYRVADTERGENVEIRIFLRAYFSHISIRNILERDIKFTLSLNISHEVGNMGTCTEILFTCLGVTYSLSEPICHIKTRTIREDDIDEQLVMDSRSHERNWMSMGNPSQTNERSCSPFS